MDSLLTLAASYRVRTVVAGEILIGHGRLTPVNRGDRFGNASED